MRYFKLLSGIICAALISFSVSADSVSIAIEATVADDFALGANTTTLPTIANNDALKDLVAGLTDLVIAEFNVKSNDPDGFRISLSSTNGGVFTSNNQSVGEIADMGGNEKMAFTLDLVLVSGDIKNLNNASADAIDISSAVNKDFTPVSGKLTAPIDLNFKVQIDAVANATLMKANYSDTITYTVADL